MKKSEQIFKIEYMLRQKREAAADLARQNYLRACENEAFAANEREITAQEMKTGRAVFTGENTQQEQTKLNSLYRRRLQLLAEMGVNKSQLVPQYDCAICKDTGIADGKHCKCFCNALFELLSENTLLKAAPVLSDISFKNENNKKVATYIKKYANNLSFMPQKNIILLGKTGTGKTHLLRALASELLRQGNSVFFLTAFHLNRLFLKIHVGSFAEKDELLSSLLDADILVIDDLGSEQIYKNVTLEYLFSIIDERQTENKPLLISTNCSLESLQTRYGERLFSRLASQRSTAILQLDSEDLRLKLF